MVAPTFFRLQLLGLLANRAFQIKYDASGITSLKRTGDVADTDYIAANAAFGRLLISR